MGNENSKDGEGGEQPDTERPPGSEKETESKLPNGDVRTPSKEPDGTTPEKEKDEEGPKEPTDVDEYTKRMTIISENVYHYVGIVAGREYAREKGLPAKEGDLPVAPAGFMRSPEKKKQDETTNDGKKESETGKPPSKDKKSPKESEKEADLSMMEFPRFYQSPGEDKDKGVTGKSSESPDITRGKAEEKSQEKDDQEKVEKMEKKPGKEAESFHIQLPRFSPSQTTDKETAHRKPEEPVSNSKVEDNKQKNYDKEVNDRKEVVPAKKADLQETKLPRFYQSDKEKAVRQSGKSSVPSEPDGKAEVKIEKDTKVDQPPQEVPEKNPEKEVLTPATKIPRFNQSPNEDKKKGSGELDKSESKDAHNDMPEERPLEKSNKVDKTDTADLHLPRFYQDNNKAIDLESDSRNLPNGDTKSKTDQKNEEHEQNPETVAKTDLPRFHPADSNEDDSETEDKQRHTTALTVGPRSKNKEEPKRKIPVSINLITVGSKRAKQNKEQDLDERTENKEKTPHEEDSLESPELASSLRRTAQSKVTTQRARDNRDSESASDPEAKATQLKPLDKKEKSVRFDDSVVEDPQPSTADSPKRVTSMVFVAPMRHSKSEDRTVNATPVELTSTTPPPASVESGTANYEDTDHDDLIAMSREETLRQTDKDSRDKDNDAVKMANDSDEEKEKKINRVTSASDNEKQGREQEKKHHKESSVDHGKGPKDKKKKIITTGTFDYDKDAKTNGGYDEPVEKQKHTQQSVTEDKEDGKGPTSISKHDSSEAIEEIITPKTASSLHSSSKVSSHSPLQKVHAVEDGSPEHAVHRLKRPAPRTTSEVNLGSGKILNAPSILMGSSITLSANRQQCETLPQDTTPPADKPRSIVSTKTKSIPKAVSVESPKRVVSRNTGTSSADDSTDGVKRESVSDEVHASIEPSVTSPTEGRKSVCTQTADAAREVVTRGAPSVLRSRSIGFQCGTGDPKRAITMQKRPSLPSADSRPSRPTETEKKTRIPLASATRPAQPEIRKSKGSPLPERKLNLSIARREAPTTTNSTSRTQPATNDSRNPHKELAKRRSLPSQSSPGCASHPSTTKLTAASPRPVRKSPMHPTGASSKSMESIPRCTCLQLSGKDSTHGDKTPPHRHPANPLGLREYGFNPPSKKPHWR